MEKAGGRNKPVSAAALRNLRENHNRAARALEHQISDLVNAAYGLTPEEIALMWQTAPPRMPIVRRSGISGYGSGARN